MSTEEEEVWRPSLHISGYDSHGPLISHPAPYRHHSVSGNPRARENQRLKTMFKTGNLTSLGKRIVEACPPEGINEQELIKKLNGLSAVSDFQRDIVGLVEAGYLIQEDGQYKRAN